MTIESGTSAAALRAAVGVQAIVDETDPGLGDVASTFGQVIANHGSVSASGVLRINSAGDDIETDPDLEYDPADVPAVMLGSDSTAIVAATTLKSLRTAITPTLTTDEVTATIATDGVLWKTSKSGDLDLGTITATSAHIGLFGAWFITATGALTLAVTGSEATYGDAGVPSLTSGKVHLHFFYVYSSSAILFWDSGLTWDTPS